MTQSWIDTLVDCSSRANLIAAESEVFWLQNLCDPLGTDQVEAEHCMETSASNSESQNLAD